MCYKIIVLLSEYMKCVLFYFEIHVVPRRSSRCEIQFLSRTDKMLEMNLMLLLLLLLLLNQLVFERQTETANLTSLTQSKTWIK